MQNPAGRGGHQPDGALERREQQRRDQHQSKRQQHDVAARVPARDEELGRVAEQVQQRLGERERPQHGEMHAVPAQLPNVKVL